MHLSWQAVDAGLTYNNIFVILSTETTIMFNVIFYKYKNGSEPIKEYIYSLAEKGKTSKSDRIKFNKIMAYIKILSEYGTRIGAPIAKNIDGEIWELRPLQDRIFFFYWRGGVFVLLHYFVKKTQKTPQREIEQAKRNMKDFVERSK
jgi:phage-related protein